MSQSRTTVHLWNFQNKKLYRKKDVYKTYINTVLMHIYWIMEPFFAFFKTMFWVIFVLLKLFLKLFCYLHASYLYACFHKYFMQYNFYILHRLFCIDKNISLSFISSSTQCSPSSLHISLLSLLIQSLALLLRSWTPSLLS